MADSIQAAVTAVAFKTTGSGSPSLSREFSNMGAQRIAQLEPPGFEMSRSGRSFVGGHSVIAGGVAGVVDLPTTTAPMVLFNSAQASGTAKHLAVKRISYSFASGTAAPAFGSSCFGAVTPSRLATALTANGSNIKTQATRGTGTPFGLIDAAKTVVQPTWMLFGGIAHGAATTMSIGYTVDFANHPFIVPPQFAFAFGVLSGLGTSSDTVWMLSVAWDEIEASIN